MQMSKNVNNDVSMNPPIRHKILSSDYCVTDKLGPLQTLILTFQHATFARRTAHEYFVLASKELMLKASLLLWIVV